MKKLRTALAVVSLTLAACAGAFAQAADPGITANGVIGEVVAVDVNAKQVFVKTDAGSVVVAVLAGNTVIKKLQPGETTLTKAADMPVGELAAGDRVFARGALSDDRKTVMARMLIVNTKADLARKHDADREEWRRRGVSGVVTALNPATKEITIQPMGGARPAGPAAGGGQGQPPAGAAPGGPPAPPAPVVIEASQPAVKFRRYTPNSVKFSDAKASAFEELKVGDQVRAKGDRSQGGARVSAEEVVSGSFRTVVGTVKGVNAATREIQIVTLEGNRPMTVVVSKDSDLKRVPEEFAQTMRGPGGGPGGGNPGAAGGQRGPGGPGGGPGEGGPRRMGGGIGEILERLPAATVEDIKPNTMVVFSTTGDDPSKATAVQLVAGVDPIVQMLQARAAAQNRPLNLGSFNLGIGQP